MPVVALLVVDLVAFEEVALADKAPGMVED